MKLHFCDKDVSLSLHGAGAMNIQMQTAPNSFQPAPFFPSNFLPLYSPGAPFVQYAPFPFPSAVPSSSHFQTMVFPTSMTPATFEASALPSPGNVAMTDIHEQTTFSAACGRQQWHGRRRLRGPGFSVLSEFHVDRAMDGHGPQREHERIGCQRREFYKAWTYRERCYSDGTRAAIGAQYSSRASPFHPVFTEEALDRHANGSSEGEDDPRSVNHRGPNEYQWKRVIDCSRFRKQVPRQKAKYEKIPKYPRRKYRKKQRRFEISEKEWGEMKMEPYGNRMNVQIEEVEEDADNTMAHLSENMKAVQLKDWDAEKKSTKVRNDEMVEWMGLGHTCNPRDKTEGSAFDLINKLNHTLDREIKLLDRGEKLHDREEKIILRQEKLIVRQENLKEREEKLTEREENVTEREERLVQLEENLIERMERVENIVNYAEGIGNCIGRAY